MLQLAAHCPKCASASSNGVLEICRIPLKGLFSSIIRKMAPETASAAIIKATKTVLFEGANMPKLTKIDTPVMVKGPA